MPYRTRWEPRGIVWTFHGFVSAAEIEAANDEFYRDERSDRARYQIIDALDVDGVEWNDRDITVTAARDSGATRVIRDLKVAYVAADAEIVGKLENYVAISRRLNSSWQFRGFATLAAARAWIES